LTPRGRRSRQALQAATEEREEALRGLCFCLLYDLCAWLTRARRPIPADVREYRLQAPRHLAEPLDRMRLYLNPELLALWEGALAPFIDSGASLSLELGEAAPLGAEGLVRGDGGVRAELRFSEQSSLVEEQGRRHPLPRRNWVLEARVSSDLDRVENACLRPA
jgi:hypothetical protein